MIYLMSQLLGLSETSSQLGFLEKNLTVYPLPQMQILKYMGNKRRLLGWLIPLLDEHLNYSDTILDLFAGTASVGYALKPKVRVIANDIQEYATVMSRALLEFNDEIKEDDFDTNLLESYNKNYHELLHIFGIPVKIEEDLIRRRNIKEYTKFCFEIPRYGNNAIKDKYKLNSYVDEAFMRSKRASAKMFPYLLFTTYYANTYFSLKQCIDIDSLRYAIDQIPNQSKQAVYLSCLMYAASKAVNSSGHFAEYLNPNSDYMSNLILEQRMISIVSYFLQKLSEFRDIHIQKQWKNRVYGHDYKELIKILVKNKEIGRIKLIYIDPPYTNAQYSRFYHIPETMVKYDYPTLTLNQTKINSVKGGYRADRHQSPFSHTSKVEEVFREIFGIISSSTDATLAISYSDNSLLKPVDKLIEIASQYYEIIDKKNGYSHSAQGSRFKHNGRGNHVVNEYLLICKRK